MRFLYRPVGLVGGLLAGLLANALFTRLWARLTNHGDVPDATQKSAGWAEIAAAAALQGAVMKGTRAMVDRAGAKGFEKATGTWPGKA